jgi:elongation factor 1-beta
VPDVAKHPNFHHWYYFINSFSNDLMAMWIEKDKGKEEKKKLEDDDDLFGDDEPAEKPKPKAPVVVKKKPKAAPKSVVVFDIKVYDTDTDLDELGKKVLAIKIDGLVWNNEPKKINVAYDIFKLQFGCVIEDEKVLTDDIFDPIEEWEEVQSVDMVSMQKI